MEHNYMRPTNPATSPNKLIFYKVERLIQNLFEKNNIKRKLDVTELYLANEEITDVPTLDHFKNLTRIWLQNNRIKKLDFFQNNTSLSEIYLQNNLLQDIKHCFRNLINLRILYLNGNQLYNLHDVTNELSYLKYLEDLNLYDNPIALEKNYRNILIHQIPSLKCVDRKVINKNEIADARKLYEKERIEIESRYAFLRCLEKSSANNNNNNNNTIIGLPDEKLRKTMNKSITTTTTTMNYVDNPLNHESKLDRNTQNFDKNKTYPRTIHEFSFFDWTKVKLYENKYKDDELRSTSTMQLQRKSNEFDDQEILKQFEQEKFNLNKTNNELSQVITIRFQ